ncbi:MAG: M20/M25/M40 family metallo-hydrolase [Planctomycetia bacterium]|nr:M20/M25/M40 family metallo-hydrolase [Planctomycetia bacterium]
MAPFLGLLGFLACRGLSAPARAADVDARNAALLSITAQDVKEYVGVLADDTFEGRESGSRGNRAAGIYLVEHLKKFGVRGGGVKDSFYQNFDAYHNILGFVDGRDQALKEEVVIIGAHYDHVGYGNSRNSFGPVGLIHNGADDNASGVAGMLEVAGAVCQLAEKPKRSILFAFWDGEEKGLLGSQHWVDHPTVPLNHVPIVINADMIGRLRNSRLSIAGVRTSRGLRRLVSRQNDVANLLIDFNWEIKPDSDHYTFYSRGIPFLMLHTGMHGDYHRPSDDADKINNEGLKQIAQLLFNVVIELAESPAVAGFRRQAKNESRRDQQASERPLPPLPSRLGIRWDEKAAEDGAIVVTAVTPASAAAKGGLKPGDRLVKFANREVRGAPEFRLSVLAAKNPVSVALQRPGEAAPVETTLELAGNPVRLGISWRTDDAEPGCVIINRLTPGSPADLAGLQINDRIYRIGGQEFATSEEFGQLATGTREALVLDVETAGRVKTVEIPPIAAELDSVPSAPPNQPASK